MDLPAVPRHRPGAKVGTTEDTPLKTEQLSVYLSEEIDNTNDSTETTALPIPSVPSSRPTRKVDQSPLPFTSSKTTSNSDESQLETIPKLPSHRPTKPTDSSTEEPLSNVAELAKIASAGPSKVYEDSSSSESPIVPSTRPSKKIEENLKLDDKVEDEENIVDLEEDSNTKDDKSLEEEASNFMDDAKDAVTEVEAEINSESPTAIKRIPVVPSRRPVKLTTPEEIKSEEEKEKEEVDGLEKTSENSVDDQEKAEISELTSEKESSNDISTTAETPELPSIPSSRPQKKSVISETSSEEETLKISPEPVVPSRRPGSKPAPLPIVTQQLELESNEPKTPSYDVILDIYDEKSPEKMKTNSAVDDSATVYPAKFDPNSDDLKSAAAVKEEPPTATQEDNAATAIEQQIKSKRAPPPPKKPSSKIAAFQQMLAQRQQQDQDMMMLPKGVSNKPKPKPKPTTDNDETRTTDDLEGEIPAPKVFGKINSPFARNLNGMLGFALPGMAPPSAIMGGGPPPFVKRPNTEENEKDDSNGVEEESEFKEVTKLTEKVTDARRSRAKGPRGRKLPNSVKDTVTVNDESLGNIKKLDLFCEDLWTVKFRGKVVEEVKEVDAAVNETDKDAVEDMGTVKYVLRDDISEAEKKDVDEESGDEVLSEEKSMEQEEEKDANFEAVQVSANSVFSATSTTVPDPEIGVYTGLEVEEVEPNTEEEVEDQLLESPVDSQQSFESVDAVETDSLELSEAEHDSEE